MLLSRSPRPEQIELIMRGCPSTLFHTMRVPARIVNKPYLKILVLFLSTATPLQAQWMSAQTGCYSDSIVANPNRPTVANPADITQYGVLELEYGFDRLWSENSVEETSIGGLLKFGMLCDI